MPLGADHVQSTRLAHLLLLLLHHQVVFSLNRGNHLANALNIGIGGGSLLGRLGDAIFKFQHGERPVTPGFHKLPAQLAEGILSGRQEGTGIESAKGLRLTESLEGIRGRTSETNSTSRWAQGNGRQVTSLLGPNQAWQQHLAQLQSRHVIAVAPKNDVGAAAGHVGSDGHGAGPAGLSNDLGFPLHVFGLGVEKVVGHLLFSKQGRKQFRFLHTGGSYKNGSATGVNLGGFSSNCLPFSCFILVHLIGPVAARARPVGGHNRDFQLVGFFEFHLLGLGRASHAGQPGIEEKEVLIGDAGQGLGFGLNLESLLGFNRLMQAITPATTRHDTSGELINDHGITGSDDVIHILHEQLFGLEGVEDEMSPGISGVV